MILDKFLYVEFNNMTSSNETGLFLTHNFLMFDDVIMSQICIKVP